MYANGVVKKGKVEENCPPLNFELLEKYQKKFIVEKFSSKKNKILGRKSPFWKNLAIKFEF